MSSYNGRLPICVALIFIDGELAGAGSKLAAVACRASYQRINVWDESNFIQTE
jgi:hypothetical protein